MSRIRNKQKLKNKLRIMLIGGGLEGIAQTAIIQKCRTYNSKANPNGFTGEDIRAILLDWKLLGYVQKFEVQQGYAKKPTTIWRATEDIKTGKL